MGASDKLFYSLFQRHPNRTLPDANGDPLVVQVLEDPGGGLAGWGPEVLGSGRLDQSCAGGEWATTGRWCHGSETSC